MPYADLHIHSIYSHDGTSDIETILKYTAAMTNLSILAITDHDEIAGALLAEKIAPAYGLQIVTGSEISTSDGHLLGLFIREKIPVGMSLYETIMVVRELGGLCVIPHPGARFTQSVSFDHIHTLLHNEQTSQTLVGMEIYNAGLLRAKSNILAANFALEHNISLVASSDAHVPGLIGKGATGFRGTTLEDLKRALVSHQTHILQQSPVSPINIVRDWMFHGYFKRPGQAWKSSFSESM